MRMIGEDAVAILPSAIISRRSRDVEYSYRQDSDFFYLTAFEEPNSLALFIPGREDGEFILFCEERDPIKEKWDGPQSGPEGAMRDFDVDDAYPIGDVDEMLPELIKTRKYIYYPMNINKEFDLKINYWMNLSSEKDIEKGEAHETLALSHLLHDMRLYKSKAEISEMRKAAKIAGNAHKNAMKKVRPNIYEYELEAEFIYVFKKFNAEYSYNPIVGGGLNACVLHYTENNSLLNDGDLVLIDAGCELNYYASDITRTFPVNGKFTTEQLEIYNIVLEAQKAAIEKVIKGNHFNDPHDAAVRIITRGLKDIGLLEGGLEDLIENNAYARFFMHRTGHWIGMDVHDVGDYKIEDEWRLLENGMVTTIEPGIYIGDEKDIPKKYRNIGVRIEDVVVVSNDSPDVLSKNIEKEPNLIELFMQQQ